MSIFTNLQDEAFAERDKETLVYIEKFIDPSRDLVLTSTELLAASLTSYKKYVGKVRDVYTNDSFVIIVATDRQSAFDRLLAAIPFKGQVLNLTSRWWFEKTRWIVPNHFLSSPHANVSICKKCTVFPIEFVMRGYITGTTSTSMWTNYLKGVRNYCGHILPEGLQKNQKLDSIKLTPTTKDDTHDELISGEEIVSSGRMSFDDFELCKKYSMQLFEYSQQEASQKGLILVDTKYEFGKDSSGKILLVDEIQTPDSSRYWVASTYQSRFDAGLEPENIDKEFLRKWYASNCNPYEDSVLPDAPAHLINELSRRYILIFEILTGERFAFQDYHTLQTDLVTAVTAYLGDDVDVEANLA